MTYRPIFFMDENFRISNEDLKKFKKCRIVQALEHFREGTKDDKLIDFAVKNDYIMVTRDTRMAFRSLLAGLSVVYINDDYKTFYFLKVRIYGRDSFFEMFEHIKKTTGYTATPTTKKQKL